MPCQPQASPGASKSLLPVEALLFLCWAVALAGLPPPLVGDGTPAKARSPKLPNPSIPPGKPTLLFRPADSASRSLPQENTSDESFGWPPMSVAPRRRLLYLSIACSNPSFMRTLLSSPRAPPHELRRRRCESFMSLSPSTECHCSGDRAGDIVIASGEQEPGRPAQLCRFSSALQGEDTPGSAMGPRCR